MKKIDMEYLPIWRRYLDWFQISKLSHKALGELLIAMMQYQFEGKEPEKQQTDGIIGHHSSGSGFCQTKIRNLRQ